MLYKCEIILLQESTNTAYKQIYEWISKNPSFYKTANEHSEISDNVINHGCTHIGVGYKHVFVLL